MGFVLLLVERTRSALEARALEVEPRAWPLSFWVERDWDEDEGRERHWRGGWLPSEALQRDTTNEANAMIIQAAR